MHLKGRVPGLWLQSAECWHYSLGGLFMVSWFPQGLCPVSQDLPLSLSWHGGHLLRGSCSQVCRGAQILGSLWRVGNGDENLRLTTQASHTRQS